METFIVLLFVLIAIGLALLLYPRSQYLTAQEARFRNDLELALGARRQREQELSRIVEYTINRNIIHVERDTGASQDIPLSRLREIWRATAPQVRHYTLRAYLSGFLSEASVIGRIKDLLQYKSTIDVDDPRVGLFIYHELRQEEEEQWSRVSPSALLEAQEPDAFLHFREIFQNLRPYSESEIKDFSEVNLNATDTALSELCRSYRSGTSLQRDFLRSQITPEQAWLLLTFSKRSAVRAARTGDAELLRDSLLALSVEDIAGEDVRDALVALALVFYCGRSIQPGAVDLFNEIMQISGPAIIRLVEDFLQREDLDNILPSMGWQRTTLLHKIK
jgi:hypothetical protein